MGGIETEVTGDMFLKETVGPDLLSFSLLLSGEQLVLWYALGHCPHTHQRSKATSPTKYGWELQNWEPKRPFALEADRLRYFIIVMES